LHELIGIVKNFILESLFCKPEELEVTSTQVRTMGWLPELPHLQGLNFSDTISCCLNSGIIHVNSH
jgi:hypothetical protein